MSGVLARQALHHMRGLRPSLTTDARGDLKRYALDPTLALREGHIKVWDPDRLSFVEFKPWPHQLESIDAWIDRDSLHAGRIQFNSVHIEKSRQMGDTVVFAYACLWVLTFWDAPLLMQHKDLSEVADGGESSTWDSFFGKIRLMHEAWPLEVGKASLHFKGGGNPMIVNRDHPFRFMTGDGATPDPGRGGRYAGCVVDEAARIAYGESAHAALARACPTGRVYLSTPEGEGNMYFRIKRDRPSGWTFVRHHWSQHPVYGRGQHIAGSRPGRCKLCLGNANDLRWDSHDPKCHRYPTKLTSPWYDTAVVELTDEQVAAELDIDYTASLAARVYGEFSEDVHVHPEFIPYDEHLPLSTCWDYGLDTTACLVLQDHPNELRIIGEWEGHDLTPDDNAAGVIKVMRALGVSERLLEPMWTLRMEAVGDPAGDSRELGTGRPLTDQYRRAGFDIFAPRQQPVGTTIIAVQRLLRGRPKRLIVSPQCWRVIEHFKGNVWPTDTRGVRKPTATAPLDNEHNHALRALAYYVQHKWPVPDEILNGNRNGRREWDHSGKRDEDLTYDMMF